MTSFEMLVENARRDYTERFHEEPVWIVSAPGRVNLIGEHTDYNAGFVFPMAIEKRTVIAAGPRRGSGKGSALIRSEIFNDEAEFLLNEKMMPAESVDWRSYVGGTISSALEQGLSVQEPFQASILSDVPLGGGLSSSASLEVSVATLLEAVSGHRVDPVEKALLCQKAEHQYAKMPCGIMDQFISAMAVKDHAMLLDCRNHAWSAVPMNDPDIVVLVINSNVKHTLSGSEYPERRADCAKAAEILGVSFLRDTTLADLEKRHALFDRFENGERIYCRARHFLTETVRTAEFAESLKNREWVRAGKLMVEGHLSLKDDFAVTCPETDKLVEIAAEIGAEGGIYGARQTGGGFGGCVVTLVQKEKADELAARIEAAYRSATGIEPASFMTRPAEGAKIV